MKIQTISGRYVDPLDLKIEDVDIEDIAHALANTCRFGGHCKRFYSVAEHCVNVSQLVGGSPERVLAALLHDAAEAYIGDVVLPIKHRLSFVHLEPPYPSVNLKDWDTSLLRIIHEALGVPMPDDDTAAAVRQADLILLATERHYLLAPSTEQWHELEGIDPLPDYGLILNTPPLDVAKFCFLTTFTEALEDLNASRSQENNPIGAG